MESESKTETRSIYLCLSAFGQHRWPSSGESDKEGVTGSLLSGEHKSGQSKDISIADVHSIVRSAISV